MVQKKSNVHLPVLSDFLDKFAANAVRGSDPKKMTVFPVLLWINEHKKNRISGLN
jgi:hypothetical protein